jgi:hypothetical protein
MIEKVDTNQIQNFLGNKPPRVKNNVAAFTGKDAEVSMQVDFASFIENAVKIPPADSKIVEQAKKLLLSGQLESPENIKQAAENILDFGI